ncbi:hypothetical protein D3C76_935340 [compost metagenome]
MSIADAVPNMVHWLGYKLRVDPGMLSPTIQLEAWRKLEEIDLEPLKEDPMDHIGEFIHVNYPRVMGVASYISPITAKLSAVKLADRMKRGAMDRVLDRCGGSGGQMIALWEALDKNTMVYVAEPDLLSYRIALVNAKLYDIPSRIINADYRHHHLGPDSPNWRYAGMWTPPQAKRYLPTMAGN